VLIILELIIMQANAAEVRNKISVDDYIKKLADTNKDLYVNSLRKSLIDAEKSKEKWGSLHDL
jgi:hypothetical protein